MVFFMLKVSAGFNKQCCQRSSGYNAIVDNTQKSCICKLYIGPVPATHPLKRLSLVMLLALHKYLFPMVQTMCDGN